MEYRDGAPAEHDRTPTLSLAEVVNALVGWSRGRTEWRSGFGWTGIGDRASDGDRVTGGG
ncbi:hypothetical protein [Kitasatospora fiedleri]|uniref:hypothetical protein n=1 Tax=Kitasatospora fiedleri TaxID=2991545 RepID=UPI00249A8B7E|nr:hypothetical protein [Kitasatospora fiedleri]